MDLRLSAAHHSLLCILSLSLSVTHTAAPATRSLTGGVRDQTGARQPPAGTVPRDSAPSAWRATWNRPPPPGQTATPERGTLQPRPRPLHRAPADPQVTPRRRWKLRLTAETLHTETESRGKAGGGSGRPGAGPDRRTSSAAARQLHGSAARWQARTAGAGRSGADGAGPGPTAADTRTKRGYLPNGDGTGHHSRPRAEERRKEKKHGPPLGSGGVAWPAPRGCHAALGAEIPGKQQTGGQETARWRRIGTGRSELQSARGGGRGSWPAEPLPTPTPP